MRPLTPTGPSASPGPRRPGPSGWSPSLRHAQWPGSGRLDCVTLVGRKDERSVARLERRLLVLTRRCRRGQQAGCERASRRAGSASVPASVTCYCLRPSEPAFVPGLGGAGDKALADLAQAATQLVRERHQPPRGGTSGGLRQVLSQVSRSWLISSKRERAQTARGSRPTGARRAPLPTV